MFKLSNTPQAHSNPSTLQKEAPREWKEEDEKSLGVVFCDGNVAMQTTLLPDDVVVHIVAERLLVGASFQPFPTFGCTFGRWLKLVC